MRLSALLAMAALLCAGCPGDSEPDMVDAGYNCELEMRDDTYSMGMSRTGDGGYEVVIVEGTPAPPGKGDNTWQLRVLDPSGDPADDLTVTVTPFMPDHGHGTPIRAVVTPSDTAGEYSVAPINLWMPGLWRVTVALSDGSPLDSIEFFFCING